jgi:hypothetical protein
MPGPSHHREQQERRALAGSTTTTTYNQSTTCPEPTTLHALANLDTSLGGRFAKADYVSGQEAAVHYPRAAGPWADPVQAPPEPPLNYEINALEPVGTAVEIERSLEELAAPLAPAEIIPGSEAVIYPAAAETGAAIPSAEVVQRRRLR